MKPRCSNQRNHALTLTEVLVILSVIALLLVVILPMSPRAIKSSGWTVCGNNQKQIGLAFKIWAGDNGGKYPMQVSVRNGGAMELAVTGNVAGIFRVMSKEVCLPIQNSWFVRKTPVGLQQRISQLISTTVKSAISLVWMQRTLNLKCFFLATTISPSAVFR
jgi:hypothetical protein